jgi:hypothetical protein
MHSTAQQRCLVEYRERQERLVSALYHVIWEMAARWATSGEPTVVYNNSAAMA